VPADFYENSLQDLFRTARSTLGQYQRRPKHARRMVEKYMRRVYIDQRGQQLAQKFVPYEVLGVISKAMLDNKCVRCRYLGKDRLLHPYALVLKSPKIYLLAVEHRRLTDSDTVTPTQYLCSRMTNPKVSDTTSRVPANFSAESFVRTHGMDVLMERESGLPRRAFTLLLRIYEGDKDNLLRDLEEFPLSSDQTIEEEAGTRHHILRAPGMRASFQLVEWILGRMERVEVIGPRSLREQIATKVSALNTIYSK